MIVPPAGTEEAATPWCTGETKPSKFELEEPDVPEHGCGCVFLWKVVRINFNFFWFAYKVEQFGKVVVVQFLVLGK